MKIHDISWDDYSGMIKSLDEHLRDNRPEGPIYLYGIPRGGQVVALLLSYLDDRYISVTSQFALEDAGAENLVIVDDILETGLVRSQVTGMFETDKLPCFVVLIDKSAVGNTEPADFSVEQMEDQTWIKFPYEKLDLEKEKQSQSERGYQ